MKKTVFARGNNSNVAIASDWEFILWNPIKFNSSILLVIQSCWQKFKKDRHTNKKCGLRLIIWLFVAFFFRVVGLGARKNPFWEWEFEECCKAYRKFEYGRYCFKWIGRGKEKKEISEERKKIKIGSNGSERKNKWKAEDQKEEKREQNSPRKREKR